MHTKKRINTKKRICETNIKTFKIKILHKNNMTDIDEDEAIRKKRKKKAYLQRKKEKKAEPEIEPEPIPVPVVETERVIPPPDSNTGRQNLKNWEHMCSVVEEYKNKFNTFPNMRNNGREVDNAAAKVLGRWLWLQTAAYKKGLMHPTHVDRLTKIGFTFA